MNILQRLFGNKGASAQQPDIPFGRYTDAYKSPAQLAAWEQSLELFAQDRPMQAYRQFLLYLRDEQEDNIRWRDDGAAIHFEFRQGSRMIHGVATASRVKAESRIARAEDLNIGFLRRLMEHNFLLKYCRFALSPENCLVVVFDTPTVDGSPLKLHNALRELAIIADKQDDLLVEEFRSLQPAELPSDTEVSEKEKAIKYEYVCREIRSALAELERGKPDPNQFPGGYAYLLLALAFRIDYLVRPEGYTMDALERIRSIYFAKDERNVQHKLLAIRKAFEQLLERPKEAFFREIYRTRSTFGLNPPVNHDRVRGIIEGELPNMDWHLNQNHQALALAVPEYIAGYTLFHYAPPKPVRELFHLLFQVLEQQYFRDLGFDLELADASGLPIRKALAAEFRRITAANNPAFPLFRPDVQRIHFSNRAQFARSYLEMVRDLNLSRAE